MADYQYNSYGGVPARRKGFLTLVILLLLAAGVVLLTQIFVVKDVQISNTHFRSAQEIVSMAGIQRGESMLLLNEQLAMKNINRDTFLECLSITKRFPDTVQIVLKEREPFASLNWLGLFTIIDKSGHVLLRGEQEEAWGHLPVVTGLDLSGIREGARLQTKQASQIEQMELLFQTLESSGMLGWVKEIDVADANDFFFLTQDDMKVSLGNLTDIAQKLAIWKVVEEQLSNEEKRLATLDVSTGTSGDYRPRPVITTSGGVDPVRNSDSSLLEIQ